MPLMSFQEALEESGDAPKNLLLGNGFSIACRPNIFTYSSLFGEADFSAIPEVEEVFREFNVRDFEKIILALQTACRILRVYEGDESQLQRTLKAHAQGLKELLVQTITQNHPDNVGGIEDREYASATRFLAYFLGDPRRGGGKVFTLNYDLLLYWTLMHAWSNAQLGIPRQSIDDGFRNDEDEPEADLLTWNSGSAYAQRVFYLHGAIHLLDTGAKLQKYTWARTGVPLMDQIRHALENDMFPLFVSEGESEQKATKIQHNAYLHHCRKKFEDSVSSARQVLFIHGHSLDANDDHLLRLIGKGSVQKVFISMMGTLDSTENQAKSARAELLAQLRDNDNPMNIYYYSAESARVWDREE